MLANAWLLQDSIVKRLHEKISCMLVVGLTLVDNLTFADDDKEEKDEVAEKKGKYAKFWKEFGKAIKLGIIEDTSNRVRLAKLLRFHRYYILNRSVLPPLRIFNCEYMSVCLVVYSFSF